MEPIICAETITKSYTQGGGNATKMEKHMVLDGVSLSINEGEFVSIMGPSGSGKSTLLFAMSGMDNVDSGTVTFDERTLTAMKEQELADFRRTKMGFVFQQPTMLKNLNILDNIILPAVSGKTAISPGAKGKFQQNSGRKNTAKMVEKATLLMKKVGILELAHRDITQVSGGQLQRAGICRALMADPSILFADEPTGALNSKSADEIMNILGQINTEGTAILLVTHDAKVAARSQRVLFMSDGKIVNELLLPKWSGKDTENRIKTVTTKMQEMGI